MNGSQRVDRDLVPDLDIKVASRRRRISQIPVLPSMLTLANLFCGFLAIAYTADAIGLAASNLPAAVDRIHDAGWIIFIAMIFDALDGKVARITGQVSKFGGELDSLADMVTFGVAPAFMTKTIAEKMLHFQNYRVTLWFSVLFVLCAALRLARYNAENDQSEGGHKSFQGLPSPGAAGIVAGLALVYARYHEVASAQQAFRVLPFVVPVLGLLMISRIPYPHMMNRFLRGSKPLSSVVLVAFIFVVAIVLRSVELVLAGALVLYAITGPVMTLVRLFRGRGGGDEELQILE